MHMALADGTSADSTSGSSARCGTVPIRTLLGIACVLALGLTACKENAYVPPPPPKVTVAQPLQQPVTRYIELTGNTQAIATVDLEARVQGYLEQINYKDGALAKKGTILFVIQRNTYEAQLLQAQAQLKSSEAV